jgi:hypothetical protein
MDRGSAEHRIRALALIGAIAFVVAGATAPAGARPSPGPTVDIQSAAGLAPDGQSMTVQVLASCPERWTVVDAFVTVSQPQASGQATFSFPCIGSLRMFSVVVQSAGGTFQLGRAQATASVVIQRGRTQRAQDSELLFVQPAVFVELADTAQLESGGGALTIAVTVACPVGASPQQSYVNVSQGQTNGNGNYVPVCDGSPHTFAVSVQASRGTYQPGEAQALTFAVVEHDGNGFAGVDDERVTLVS